MEQEITSERWRLVKQIFQAAVELPGAERDAYLADACADDPSLRAEIESLIAAHEQPGSFMDTPLFDLVEEPSANSLLGKSLGRYRIMAMLGRGGVGEVYKAKDTVLGRDVAIKVLSSGFSSDQDRLSRFAQEARAASALNHPNIITIHEFGQAEGFHFIVSEFIEGQTLRRLMASRRMNTGEILEIAIQIANALNAAHEAGIVHRDIKPENIMARPDGLIKVLDFGLAKLIEPSAPANAANDTEASTRDLGRTAAGIVMGTVNYMSPEQARGLSVDARTDIFSLGVVLYEMTTGRAPFARATVADVIASILEKEPPPFAESTSEATEAPEAMEAIIRKALRKDRGERYQTVGGLLADLKSLKSGEAVAALQPAKSENLIGMLKRRWRAAAITLVALAAIAAAVYFSKNERAIESVAVLPLINADGNPETEYLADGLTESLINSLTQLPNLTVRPRNQVFRYKKRDTDPQIAGRELEVETVLTGQMSLRGEQIIISLQLIDARENRQLWGERYQRKFADILRTQEEIARKVSENLRLRLSSADERRLAKHYTDNFEAYRAYLIGRDFWNKRNRKGFEKAIDHFNQAIAIDPNYALAYSGLADCYIAMTTYGEIPPSEGFSRAKDAAKKALAIDDTLAEAHTSLAHLTWLHEWDWAGGEREFERAITLNPKYEMAHQWYATYLSAMGRHKEAIASIKRAHELDPTSSIIGLDVARTYYFATLYDQAIEQCLKVFAADPDFNRISDWLAMAYEQQGLHDKAFEENLKVFARRGVSPEIMLALKKAYDTSGWKGFWRKHLEWTQKEARERYVPPYFMARIYVRLGAHDQALEWLQKAYDRHSDYLVVLKVEPLFDPLRSDPRFTKLLRDIGFAP
ncbi:MAG: protein kinase [Blastocatellales bacterium]